MPDTQKDINQQMLEYASIGVDRGKLVGTFIATYGAADTVISTDVPLIIDGDRDSIYKLMIDNNTGATDTNVALTITVNDYILTAKFPHSTFAIASDGRGQFLIQGIFVPSAKIDVTITAASAPTAGKTVNVYLYKVR